MQHMYQTNNTRGGYTIVELNVAVTLSVSIVVIFISVMMSTYLRSGENVTQLELNGNLQIALNDIERDIRYSSVYSKNLTSPFSDSNAPSGGWTFKGTPSDPNKRVLILRASATENNPFSNLRSPVYIDGGSINPYAESDPRLNCSSTPPAGTLRLNPQLPYYVIYFVQNNVLYRRILTDTTTSICNGVVQYQKTSCPTGSGAGCLAKDEVIASDVAQFSVNYYERADTPSTVLEPIDPYREVNPDDLAQADNVEVIIRLERTIAGKLVTSTLSVMGTRVNEL